MNWFNAFSNKPSLKVAKLPACYMLKFSSLNLVVRAILILPYIGRLSGPFLSDSSQWITCLEFTVATSSDGLLLNALKQFTNGPLHPLIAITPQLTGGDEDGQRDRVITY